jgi:anti-sigma B factor antagonist
LAAVSLDVKDPANGLPGDILDTVTGPHVQVEHTGTECLVTMRGDIDVYAVADVQTLVVKTLAECTDHAPTLVVDMTGVGFVDSTGLGMLVNLAHAAADRGQTTQLRGLAPRIVRLLQISGLDELFTIA